MGLPVSWSFLLNEINTRELMTESYKPLRSLLAPASCFISFRKEKFLLKTSSSRVILVAKVSCNITSISSFQCIRLLGFRLARKDYDESNSIIYWFICSLYQLRNDCFHPFGNITLSWKNILNYGLLSQWLMRWCVNALLMGLSSNESWLIKAAQDLLRKL